MKKILLELDFMRVFLQIYLIFHDVLLNYINADSFLQTVASHLA